tara:strand:- start:586 stop:957 length:372 start_codon:yes stop_codon:yes gene_type:complete
MDTNGLEMVKRRRRRNWSDDEKRMICAQTRFPGVSVSQVARRYDVNANQVFNWLKDPLFAAPPDDVDIAMFLPVEVVDPVPSEPAAPEDFGEMLIDVAGGHRLTVKGAFCPDALALLIRKISG